LASERMPHPPKKLSSSSREAMMSALCHHATMSWQECRGMLWPHEPEWATPPGEFLRLVQTRTPPGPSESDGALATTMPSATHPAVRDVPTLGAWRLLVVAEHCTEAEKKGTARFEDCASALLSHGAIWMPKAAFEESPDESVHP